MKLTICKQRFELIPLIFATASIILLICLGNWQLQRLFAKENFIATIESNIINPAKTLDNFQTSPPNAPPISAPLVPMFTFAIPQSDPDGEIHFIADCILLVNSDEL